MALPSMHAFVDGRKVRVLIDSCCSRSMIAKTFCKSFRNFTATRVYNFEGGSSECVGEIVATIAFEGMRELNVTCLVMENLITDVIIGMDVIDCLGGVYVYGDRASFGCICRSTIGNVTGCDNGPRHGQVSLVSPLNANDCNGTSSVSQTEVEESDFRASFDRAKKEWVVEWKWSNGREPVELKNSIAEYRVPDTVRPDFEAEIKRWISEGWLAVYDDVKLGSPKGLIPLLAVVQQNKEKTRPVLDFRELNSLIDVYTANADVCSDKLREWRRQGTNTSLLDLSSAYMQIGVKPSLWPFQTVIFQGQRYCLTRLGFGLNVAPLAMKAILAYVLGQDNLVEAGTSPYVDDIYVNEDIVKVQYVRDHLARFGLVCKPEERVADGARVLGLRVCKKPTNKSTQMDSTQLQWTRANQIPNAPDTLTKRTVFSFCGKMVSHLPVCGWLRPAVAFVKRRANARSEGWDDKIEDNALRTVIAEIRQRVIDSDPCRGQWNVDGHETVLWVDASSMAIGSVLQVHGRTIEDACWLRSQHERDGHINMAELDAVLKGMNIAMSWNMKTIHLKTDSLTVYHWISDALTGKARIKTKAASEMLIRRRVGVFKALVEEYSLNVDVQLVSSSENLSDELTRVPSRWLKMGNDDQRDSVKHACVSAVTPEAPISEIHKATGHQGVLRTLYFTRVKHPHVTHSQVEEAVRSCQDCQSIDPPAVKWEKGRIGVDGV